MFKKSLTIIAFALASILFQVSVTAINDYEVTSSTYEGMFYLTGNGNSSCYMSINQYDTIMHNVFYSYNGVSILLYAYQPSSVHFSLSGLDVYYPNSNNSYCWKSSLNGDNYGYISGEVQILTSNIVVTYGLYSSITKITVNYMSYPYVKNV